MDMAKLIGAFLQQWVAKMCNNLFSFNAIIYSWGKTTDFFLVWIIQIKRVFFDIFVSVTVQNKGKVCYWKWKIQVYSYDDVILKGRAARTWVHLLDRYCKCVKRVDWRKKLFWIGLKLFGKKARAVKKRLTLVCDASGDV